MVTPTPDAVAISFRVEARPPRVGSRMACTAGPAASSTAAIMPLRAAQSERIWLSNSRPSRTLMMAMPWSPMVPETRMASPGCARWGKPYADSLPQQAHAGGVDIAAVAMAALDHLGVSGHDLDAGRRGGIGLRACTMAASWASGNPSSRMKLALRNFGSAPETARSLTVPLTASAPMDPPGKKKRPHDEGICAHGQAARGEVEDGRVAEILERRVAERGKKKMLNKLVAELAAASMAHHDVRIADQGQRAGPVGEVGRGVGFGQLKFPSGIREGLLASSRTGSSQFFRRNVPSIVVIRRAGAFARKSAGCAQRMPRRAFLAEGRALGGASMMLRSTSPERQSFDSSVWMCR